MFCELRRELNLNLYGKKEKKKKTSTRAGREKWRGSKSMLRALKDVLPDGRSNGPENMPEPVPRAPLC